MMNSGYTGILAIELRDDRAIVSFDDQPTFRCDWLWDSGSVYLELPELYSAVPQREIDDALRSAIERWDDECREEPDGFGDGGAVIRWGN